MVSKFAFLLQELELKQLNNLCGAVQVLRRANAKIDVTEVLLQADNRAVTRLRVGYDDVGFKFECFHILVDIVTKPFDTEVTVVATIDKWTSIDCLYHAEWERAALPGEVAAGQDQIVRQLLSQVPNIALACVSMTGVLFLGQNEVPRLLVKTDVDSDDPLSLEVIEGNAIMSALEDAFERVKAKDVQAWQSKLTGWAVR